MKYLAIVGVVLMCILDISWTLFIAAMAVYVWVVIV